MRRSIDPFDGISGEGRMIKRRQQGRAGGCARCPLGRMAISVMVPLDWRRSEFLRRLVICN